eukprot:1157970-Pelagomonas_calceolata.AAC.1
MIYFLYGISTPDLNTGSHNGPHLQISTTDLNYKLACLVTTRAHRLFLAPSMCLMFFYRPSYPWCFARRTFNLKGLQIKPGTACAEPPKRAAGAARDSRVGTAGTASDSVRKDFSFGRAGVMQQAIVLMADRVDVTQLEVRITRFSEGLIRNQFVSAGVMQNALSSGLSGQICHTEIYGGACTRKEKDGNRNRTSQGGRVHSRKTRHQHHHASASLIEGCGGYSCPGWMYTACCCGPVATPLSQLHFSPSGPPLHLVLHHGPPSWSSIMVLHGPPLHLVLHSIWSSIMVLHLVLHSIWSCLNSVLFPWRTQVLVEGHDGQLPKLDMYYMLRTAARYTTSIRVKPRAEHAQPLWLLRPVMDLVKVEMTVKGSRSVRLQSIAGIPRDPVWPSPHSGVCTAGTIRWPLQYANISVVALHCERSCVAKPSQQSLRTRHHTMAICFQASVVTSCIRQRGHFQPHLVLRVALNCEASFQVASAQQWQSSAMRGLFHSQTWPNCS